MRGFGVLIIVTWNKITIFCLPLLAASFNRRSKLILILIVLTHCFHVLQTKHLRAGPLSTTSTFLVASTSCLISGEAKNYSRQDETWNFNHEIKQYDWFCWNWMKNTFIFYFVTLVDVPPPLGLLLIPAVSCFGWWQIVRLLKETQPTFTWKEAVNATVFPQFTWTYNQSNNCCLALFSITFLFVYEAISVNYRPLFIFINAYIPHIHENVRLQDPFLFLLFNERQNKEWWKTFLCGGFKNLIFCPH